MPLRRRRILVVDHDTVTGAAAAAQLRLDERHDVLLVHAAAGARQTIESADARFDLLITELDLGDGDGLTVLLSALKLDSPPLLVLVSNADPEVLTPIQDMVNQASGRPLILLSKPLVPALLEPVLEQMRSVLPDQPEDEPCRPIEEIESAMRSREFVLVLEPQIDLQTGVVAGFEGLARWQHPSRGLLGPRHFIRQSNSPR